MSNPTLVTHRNLFDVLCQRTHSAFQRFVLSPPRKRFYISRGAQIGRGTEVPAITIPWPHQVSIGVNCKLEPGIVLKYAHVSSPGPNIIIGDNTFIGQGCQFNIYTQIKIENDCWIASGCRFIDFNHNIPAPGKLIDHLGYGEPIFIGRNVWVGSGVTVLKGVKVGQGAVIGAGSVVTKSIPAFEIWAGVPAKKIGQR